MLYYLPVQYSYIKMNLPTWSQVWQETRRFSVLTFGAVLSALGYVLFQVPHNLSGGGLSGISIVVNHFTAWPIGLLFWFMNLPLLALGYFYLGRWRFVGTTMLATSIFSFTTDFLLIYLPELMPVYPITDDLLLNAIYGGIVGGIGGGLIFRAGSTMGGTGIIGRIIQQKTGMPLSQIYLFTDGLIIFVMGVVFGWQIALYAFLVLFINGLASDYTLEGASSTRTVMIVTDSPQEISKMLMQELHRGVTYWEVTGGYTGETRYLVLCTIYRPQVNRVKRLVADTDPAAFLTIGLSHQAFGNGFVPFRART